MSFQESVWLKISSVFENLFNIGITRNEKSIYYNFENTDTDMLRNLALTYVLWSEITRCPIRNNETDRIIAESAQKWKDITWREISRHSNKSTILKHISGLSDDIRISRIGKEIYVAT